MAAPAEQKKIGPDMGVCRDLLCAGEWDEPAGRTVISEYHKDGLAAERPQIEADLDAFDKYWGKRNGAKVTGEYHAEGAPDPESPSSWERKPSGSAKRPAEPAAVPSPQKPAAAGSEEEKETIDRPIDLTTAEVITYALFRMMFGRGLHIPVKREGLVDLDITVRGNDVNVNTNQLLYAVPELTVWRVIYSHQGKPVFEFGRGLKNGSRIHYLNAAVLLMTLWRQSREINKAKALKKKAEAGP